MQIRTENAFNQVEQPLAVTDPDSMEPQVSIFPNPTLGRKIHIRYSNANGFNDVLLFDLNGKKYDLLATPSKQDDYLVVLPDQIQKGLYFLRLGNLTKKLIID